MTEELNKCVWMWAGLLTYRLCDREYQCSDCPVEALFHPRSPSGAGAVKPATPSSAALAQRSWAGDDRFHDEQHLWLRILPAGRVAVGFDPMASNLLRPARSLELPPEGKTLQAGEVAIRARLDGGAVEFASPVEGEVLRAHRPAPGRFASMFRSPYTRAWMLVLKITHLERQLSRLSFGRKLGQQMAREWTEFQQECLGLAAGPSGVPPVLPDGGELDLDRLASTVGPVYPSLVRRWIGVEKLNTGRAASRAPRKGRASRGGTEVPPEER